MTARARRQFTPEFKAEAVRLVRSGGKTVAQIARELDLTDSALRTWVERAQHAGSSDLSAGERHELQQLRTQRELRTAHGA